MRLREEQSKRALGVEGEINVVSYRWRTRMLVRV